MSLPSVDNSIGESGESGALPGGVGAHDLTVARLRIWRLGFESLAARH